jgi:hypothetical protein
MSDWILIDRANIDHSKRYWVAWQDEREPTLSRGNDVSKWRSLIAAVMECTPPEPYVPPVPERAKRRSLKMLIGESEVLFREVLKEDEVSECQRNET